MINVIAGGRYPFTKFLFFDLPGQFFWVLLYSGLGYLFASQWEQASRAISLFSGLSLGLFFLVPGTYYLLRRRKTSLANRLVHGKIEDNGLCLNFWQ